MYVLNLTFSIDKNIFQEWMDWYNEHGASKFSNNTLVTTVKLFNILGTEKEEDITRCVHLEFEDNQKLHHFYTREFVQISGEIKNKFGDKCLYFGSVLELIKEN